MRTGAGVDELVAGRGRGERVARPSRRASGECSPAAGAALPRRQLARPGSRQCAGVAAADDLVGGTGAGALDRPARPIQQERAVLQRPGRHVRRRGRPGHDEHPGHGRGGEGSTPPEPPRARVLCSIAVHPVSSHVSWTIPRIRSEGMPAVSFSSAAVAVEETRRGRARSRPPGRGWSRGSGRGRAREIAREARRRRSPASATFCAVTPGQKHSAMNVVTPRARCRSDSI